MISTNAIIDGIGAALNDEFGGDYTIYSETVLQGIKLPCFVIHEFDSDYERQPSGVKRFERRFVITYLPADEALNPAAECADIAERLYQCLDFITVDGELTHGANLRHEYDSEDKSLRFYADFIYLVRTVKDTSLMETLKQNSGLKG